MDLFEHAKQGKAEYFEGVEPDIIRKARDASHFGSVLYWAVMTGHLRCSQVIYRRCPDLLYKTTNNGNSVLHNAAWDGRDKIIKFLLTAKAKLEQEVNGTTTQSVGEEELVDYTLLSMLTVIHETALHHAARQGHPLSAKILIKADPGNKLLGMVTTNEKQTAMHVAVKTRQTEIVEMLVQADPDFQYSTDKFGNTPLLIALEEARSGDQKAGEIRKFLIQKQPKQCNIPIGSYGWNLLHHATFKGDSAAIKEIIQYNRDSSESVDNEGRNFLHLAVIFEHENVVKQILGFLNMKDDILNAQDFKGDTPLHNATSRGSESTANPLLYDPRVNKMIKNNKGKTALDDIRFKFDKRKAGVLGLTSGVDEEDLKDRSSFDLVVGALISAVSFTAGITVPGGFISDGRSKGTAILLKKPTFVAFMAADTTALALSLLAVFIHFCLKDVVDEKEITFQLKVAAISSIGSIFALMVAFIMGTLAVLSPSLLLVLIVCGICSIVFGCAFYLWWRTRRLRKRRHS